MSKPLVSAAAQLTKLPLHSTENAFDFMSPYDTKYSSQDVHELINKASSNLFGHLPPGKRVEINHIRVTPESLASFAEDYSGHTFQLLRASAICPASTKIVLDDERQFAISPTLRTISFVKFETTRFEQKGHWVHVLVDFARKELLYEDPLSRVRPSTSGLSERATVWPNGCVDQISSILWQRHSSMKPTVLAVDLLRGQLLSAYWRQPIFISTTTQLGCGKGISQCS